MTDTENIMIDRFCRRVETNGVSNEFLVQIIELAGSYLNLKTISAYAKENNMSYNGVKKYRQNLKIFGVKFVIDNT